MAGGGISSGATSRRRAERREARRRILDAGRELLEAHAWHELPLDEVMTRAGLSRTIFYRHFEDRQHLLLALLDEIGEDLAATGDLWTRGEGDPLDQTVRGLEALTALYAEHGRLLQALADAAGQDGEVREVYERLGERFRDAVEAQIRAEIAAGRSGVRDPREVARALIWMNERYLLACFGRSRDADPAAVSAALTEVWTATVYLRRPSNR